ncbi:MAG: metallophosphoesterase family protein [Treponema sp.]|nr:metallophosphoesterase family protein [Treponema sp.]
MTFLVISDVHGNIAMLDKLDAQFRAVDAVLFGGDFAAFNKPETGLPALEALCKKHETIFAVIGNCDEPDFRAELERKDISVEGALLFHDGLAFAGSGGGSKFSGDTPNERSDEDLAADFALVEQSTGAAPHGRWNNLIAIMHNPPKDTACDVIAGGMHVGSPALRRFIDVHQPLAVITGHIHESAAVDVIGQTTLINPGALFEGKYARLSVANDGGMWRVTDASLACL